MILVLTWYLFLYWTTTTDRYHRWQRQSAQWVADKLGTESKEQDFG